MSGERGFTVVSVLVGLVLTAVLMAGAMRLLSLQTEAQLQQDLAMALEQNLRVGVAQVVDALRAASAPVPAAALATWIPWVANFTTNPLVEGNPARLSVAACTAMPVATLAAPAAAGAVMLSLASDVPGTALSGLLDAGSRRLIVIDDREGAHVTALEGHTVMIDTQPTQTGTQGLSRSYPAGTTLCRVDVTTLALATSSSSGRYELTRDLHQGGDPEPVADGISALEITPIEMGRAYQLSLTARSERPSPLSGLALERTLVASVWVRNAP